MLHYCNTWTIVKMAFASVFQGIFNFINSLIVEYPGSFSAFWYGVFLLALAVGPNLQEHCAFDVWAYYWGNVLLSLVSGIYLAQSIIDWTRERR